MAFEDTFRATKESIQSSLDDISSPRTSSKAKLDALKSIERNIAVACCHPEGNQDAKDSFLALQYTFECNIPSRLLSYITLSAATLESIVNKGVIDEERKGETEGLTTQLILSLSIIQGVALNHSPSKAFLGRKCALEILLDLLLLSRHLSNPPQLDPKTVPPEPLTSIVLDTLLCVLVDSSPSLRAFEEANGVQAVVKILKRAGTPREVRMKCLEFLYFYLLDETPQAQVLLPLESPSPRPTPQISSPPASARPAKPSLSATPMRPSSRYGSSTYAFSGKDTLSGSTSSRSTSGGSTRSFNSASSTSTAPSSLSSSPQKVSSMASPTKLSSKSPIKRMITPQNQPKTPPTSPPGRFPQLRSMMMLKKDVDYTPQSPKKPPVLSPRQPTHAKSQSMSSMLPSGRIRSTVFKPRGEPEPEALSADEVNNQDMNKQNGQWKTTEQKKELLGTMLGNVDALVEGVRKAGIWGLG